MQSKGSNCKVDSDKILVDVTIVVMVIYRKPFPAGIEKPLTTDIAMVIQPPHSIPAQSISAYLAGYLLRKITTDDCSECLDELMLPELASDFTRLIFLWVYKKQNLPRRSVFDLPKSKDGNIYQHIQNAFCAIFQQIIHMQFILARLAKSVSRNTVPSWLVHSQNVSREYILWLHFLWWSE